MLASCEHLCLSKFQANYLYFQHERFFDALIGKETSSFCYVSKGFVTFETVTKKTTANPGDFLYMPCGMRYTSSWVGNPHIEFFGIDFQFKKCNNVRFDQQFDFIKIPAMSNINVGRLVQSIRNESRSNEPNQLNAISKFYQLFSMALPYLTKTNPLELPAPIQTAVSYIEKNLKRIFL